MIKKGLLFTLLAGLFLASAAAQTIRLPFSDFDPGKKPDPGWVADASGGNTVTFTDSGIVIRAASNTYAHVRHELGVDYVRASCRIRPGSGISWATSVFFYWTPGNWCQFAVIPRNGGCYYACIMEDGQPEEYDLGRCVYGTWQDVSLELGKDVIRFGSAGKTELAVTRPQALSGAPKLIVLGKGYAQNSDTRDLDSDYTDRGEVSVSSIRGLQIAETPSSRMEMSRKERLALAAAEKDTLGEEVIAKPSDPNYDLVAGYLPALAHPREVVGVKDHGFDIGVAYDGSLQIATDRDGWQDDGPRAFFTIDGVRFGKGGCKKQLLRGYLPVVLSRWTNGGIICEEEAFGWSAGMRDNTPLWCCVRMKVTSKAARRSEIALCVLPDSLGFIPVRRSVELSPGDTSIVCFQIPSPLGNGRLSEISGREFTERLDEAESTWMKILEGCMSITVPEKRVEEAWKAWLVYNFLNVDRNGDRFDIHDGSGFYEQIYGYSAALFCHALDLYGDHADARRYLESMFTMVRPEGLFFENYGYPDEGALLFASAEHYRLTGDSAWLRSVSPVMIKMCNWIIENRKTSMNDPAITRGLIRFTPYADYKEKTYDYYGDAYGCIGLESAAGVFSEIGMEEESGRIAAEASRYRQDILASMDRSVIERDGSKVLPMEPATLRLLKSTGYRAGGYYGLVASMMLESGFLAPEDPRARLVTDFMERKRGLILGMCEFNGGVDHAYTYGYWINCLRRNEIKRVLLGFYSSLAYGMGRDTYCGVEVTYLKTGNGTATTPHTYSGTQQLRLLRMMLLREESDTLLLAYGIPRHWLRPGERVEIRNAPTLFGNASYTVESGRDTVNITVDVPERREMKAVKIRLRRPDQRPIRHVDVNGRPVATFRGDAITLKPALGAMRITVAY